MKLDTPPSSVNGDDEINNEDFLEEDEELVYVGDLDDVLEAAEDDSDNNGEEEDSEPPPDDSAMVFSEHKSSVFCGAIHPNGQIAISGGEDDKAYIWNIKSGEIIHEFTQFDDSVIVSGFSHDGVYVAAIDIGGNVKVLKCNGSNGIEEPWKVIWENQVGDVCWGRWHPATRVLFAGTVAGEIYMWKIPSGETKVLQGHGQKCESGVVLTDGRRLAAGYEDGSVKIWDLKSSTVIHHISMDNAEEEPSPMTAIDTYHDNNIIAVGSVDGKVTLIKSATGKPIGILDAGSEVETLRFCQDSSLSLLAVGTLKGSVTIWDVARQTVRHKCADSKDENASGIVSLFWIKTIIVTACLDGSIRIYDGKSGNTLKNLTGHRAELLDITYSPEANIILTTSEDSTCRVFPFDITVPS